MKPTAFLTLWILAAPLLNPGVAGAEVIKDIVVEGNSKTTDETVILIADIEVGDEFTPDMVPRVQAKLVDSGLFKGVEVAYADFQGGFRIIIEAKDKHSWVVAPTYYNQPTNKGGGIGFGENNLFGTNKKLLLYAQLATGDSFFVGGYIDPSIAGTRFTWQADVYLLRGRIIEYAPPTQHRGEQPIELRKSKLNYLNGGLRLGVNLFGGVSLNTRLRSAKVFYDDTELANEDVSIEQITGDPNSAAVPEPGLEGNDTSVEVRLDYDKRANWYGITHGDRYRLIFERSLSALGSDFDYWAASLRVERARKFYARHNFIIKAEASYGRDLPFQREFTSGGTDQRGFKNAQFRGNLKLAGNVEYSMPVITIKGVALRLLGFYDTSYTTFYDTEENTSVRSYLPNHESTDASPFKNTVGLGTRLYIRQIVLPLLGLDVGYGLERGEIEIYLAIGLTDV